MCGGFVSTPKPSVPQTVIPETPATPPAPEMSAQTPVTGNNRTAEGSKRTTSKAAEINAARVGTSPLKIDLNIPQPAGVGLNIPQG